MALAFDAVGPSSTGATITSSSTLSWSHTVSGSNTLLLVGVAVGQDSNPAISSVTYKGAAMTSLGTVLPNGMSGAGYLQVFLLIGAATGANTVLVTAATTTNRLTGGSMSFNGANQATGIGTKYTATGSGGTAQATVSTTTSGNIVAGFTGNGSGTLSATSPATSRFIAAGDASTGSSNGAGATSPSTGSSMAIAWTVSADWWSVMAFEVQVAVAIKNTGGLFPIVQF